MDARNPLDSYEQLKRKNRRRLVGAVAMVAAAGGLLLAVSGQDEAPVAEQQLVLDSSGTPVADAPETLPENGEAAASQADGALVLEPAPGADEGGSRNNVPVVAQTSAPAAVGQSKTEGKVAVTTEVKPPLPQRPQEAAPQPAAQADNKPVPKAESKPAAKAETKQEVNTDSKPAAPAVEKTAPKAETKPAPKPEPQAPAPTVVFKPKENTGNKTAAKPAVKPVTKPQTAGRADTEARKPSAKLTPQEILNNKAAGQVSGGNNSQTAAKPADPQAILDGKTGGKAQVQVGAYASEQQAKAVQQKLAAAGVNTSISASETSKGTVYRVRTATFDNRAQAEQTLQKIQAQGLGGMVVSR